MVAKKVKNKLEWKLEKGVLKIIKGKSCYYVLWEVTRESVVEFISRIESISSFPTVGISLGKVDGRIDFLTIDDVSIHGLFEDCLMCRKGDGNVYKIPKQFIIDLIGEIK